MSFKGIPVLSRRRRVVLVCEVCHAEFETHRFRAASARFCSKACWSHRGVLRPTIPCLNCGKAVRVTPKVPRMFCSTTCTYAYRIGPNAPAWKDGESLERERARISRPLAVWRTAVFKRDAHTCQLCGKHGKGVIIHAHHLKSFADNSALRLDLDNGQTLCIDCHGRIHGKDFTNRRQKFCKECGKPVSGQNGGVHCHSCATRLWHQGRVKPSLGPTVSHSQA